MLRPGPRRREPLLHGGEEHAGVGGCGAAQLDLPLAPRADHAGAGIGRGDPVVDELRDQPSLGGEQRVRGAGVEDAGDRLQWRVRHGRDGCADGIRHVFVVCLTERPVKLRAAAADARALDVPARVRAAAAAAQGVPGRRERVLGRVEVARVEFAQLGSATDATPGRP